MMYFAELLEGKWDRMSIWLKGGRLVISRGFSGCPWQLGKKAFIALRYLYFDYIIPTSTESSLTPTALVVQGFSGSLNRSDCDQSHAQAPMEDGTSLETRGASSRNCRYSSIVLE
jgi:hypothetical protein